MPPVVLRDGKAAMFNPMTGEQRFVTQEEFAGAREQGFVPETPDSLHDAALSKEFDRPGAAFALGAARGLTLGGSDVLARAAGVEGAVRQFKEESPFISGAGDVAGSLAGLAIPLGPVGLATRGAAKAASVAGRLGRGAETIAKVGLEGAAFGAGAGISDVALSDQKDIELIGALEHVGKSAAMGAAMGGGIASVGVGLGKAGNWVFGKAVGDAPKKIGKLRAEQDELSKRIDGLNGFVSKAESDAAAIEHLEKEAFAQFRAKYGDKNFNYGWAKMRLKNVKEMISDATKDGEPEHIIAGYKAEYQKLKQIVDDAATARGHAEKRKAILKSAEDYRNSLKSDMGRLAEVNTEIADITSKAVGKVVDGVSKGVVDAGVAVSSRMLLGSGWVAPLIMRSLFKDKFSGLVKAVSGGLEKVPGLQRFVQQSVERGSLNIPGNSIIKGMRPLTVPAEKMMTPSDYAAIQDELELHDGDETEYTLRAAMPIETPTDMGNEIIQRNALAVNYLKSVSPKKVKPDSFIDDDPDAYAPTDEELMAFSRKVRATVAPQSVIDDFSKKKLTEEGAEAWWAVYPSEAKEIAEFVKSVMKIAVLNGQKYSDDDKHQLALITGETKMGRMFDPDLIRAMQQNYTQTEKPSARQPTRTNVKGLATPYAGALESIQRRAG